MSGFGGTAIDGGLVMASAVCRDCAAALPGPMLRCPKCDGRRVFAHPELHTLHIGHIDADSFYATIEKRDRPELADKPVIVGGMGRGVVAACCYVARMYGIRSAMPTAQALERCPDAVVIPPNMAKYSEVGHQARSIMSAFTELMEPISIDEAYLDLSGIEERLHISPAQAVVEIVRRFELDLGITASIGLSYNKLLAKVASDLSKPRGLSVIGRAEAVDFLASKPVKILWGVGPALEHRLYVDGIRKVADLHDISEIDLVRRYGSIGRQLYRYARDEDIRRVEVEAPNKSVSAEDTLDWPTGELGALKHELWRMCDKAAQRMAREGVVGHSLILKLKTADFQIISRSRRVDPPTRTANVIYEALLPLLEREADGRAFRLVGAGFADLVDEQRNPQPDLFV